ncbi:cellulose synthase-like protein E1 [Chenopodium quinoa]|uniref:cellulose synthase-like protein E1 n=1 Tax=Chenopodium quinoa TaxID=63459 RepID=UPI000B78054E|nr:cellulose synthase-like protein E1 [Chenopodium quinoa]
MREKMGKDEYFPLFETKQAKGRLIYRVFATSILVAICVIWVYRCSYMPKKVGEGRLGWVALFMAEIWFGFYWILSQVFRWNCIYRYSFKDRLSNRYENDLPTVDIFVCTADPLIEPPLMVINTVLSVMAYDYPPEKLSIYLSDDGGSILTFYALFEASQFSKNWLPYCKKYKVEPRSPASYFRSMLEPTNATHSSHFTSIKKLYEEMQTRIEMASNLSQIPEEVRDQHKGFSTWNDSYTSKRDHDTILQILIDGRDKTTIEVEGCQMPTLVYLAREKRPQFFHNFKAGAMNALLRVSSKISNGPVILNVDCDMYSNDSQSIRDALCFFMDEKMSQDIAFVQFPQRFENTTKNDIYGSALQTSYEVEFHGLDGFGGPLYIGTGCFHQREILCGRRYSKDYKIDWKNSNVVGTIDELEESAKSLASCTYELNSQWGKEMGLKYGCPIEDVITGLAIQCRGWKSVYMNPKRSAFLGLAATTLDDTLVQHKRWSEGELHIMLTHCPLWYGHKRIHLGLQSGYCYYSLWAVNSLATLCYCTVPSLYMLGDISLFPKLPSPWFFPFAYVIIVTYTYNLVEFVYTGGTILGWWNEQRIWLYRRISSYLFALIDTMLNLIGFSKMKFVITNKVADEAVSKRYEKEIMEFGVTSPMFTMLTSLAFINLFTFVVLIKKLLVGGEIIRGMIIERLSLQILLCFVLILINYPLFKAVFIRKDKGKMPSSVTIKASVVSVIIVLYFCY